jgi:hypothetical protein
MTHRRTFQQYDIKEATFQLPVRTGVLAQEAVIAMIPLSGLCRTDGKYVPFIWKVKEFRVSEEMSESFIRPQTRFHNRKSVQGF